MIVKKFEIFFFLKSEMLTKKCQFPKKCHYSKEMSIYSKERIKQKRCKVEGVLLDSNRNRFKGQGNCWCEACTKNRTRYVIYHRSKYVKCRICDECFEKGKWHLFTKPKIIEILKKEYINVPNDIWKYLLLFLEWTVE